MDELTYTNIARYLTGEATEAERAELEDWMAADPLNIDTYNEIKRIWEKSDTLIAGPTVDKAKAWEKVSARIQKPAAPTVDKGKVISFPAWARYSVAAAAILLVGMFVMKFYNNAGEITVIAANNEQITLPDNTVVALKKGSTLRYPEVFAANERNVRLEGEAFFEVTRNEHKPFIIDAQSVEVKVLGTSFNVKCNKDEAVVVVATGKVQVTSLKEKNKKLLLLPGKKGLMKKGELTMDSTITYNYLYWQTGTLKFESYPLEKVVKELSEAMDATVMLDETMPAMMKQQIINISFHNQTIEEMLTELCLISRCQWTKDNKTYIIKSK